MAARTPWMKVCPAWAWRPASRRCAARRPQLPFGVSPRDVEGVRARFPRLLPAAGPRRSAQAPEPDARAERPGPPLAAADGPGSAQLRVHRCRAGAVVAAQLHLRQPDGVGDRDHRRHERHGCGRLPQSGRSARRQRRVPDAEPQQAHRHPVPGQRRRVHRPLRRDGVVRRRTLRDAAHRAHEHHRRDDHRRRQARRLLPHVRAGARRPDRATARRPGSCRVERLRRPQHGRDVRQPRARRPRLSPAGKAGVPLRDRVDAGRPDGRRSNPGWTDHGVRRRHQPDRGPRRSPVLRRRPHPGDERGARCRARSRSSTRAADPS